MEVTKTAIHRLAARGWLQKGVSPIDPIMLKCPTLQQEKVYLQPGTNVVLVYISNFALHDNCEGGEFFLLLIPLV